MTVTVRYEGEGEFFDPDKATKFAGSSVNAGGEFTTSKKRLEELQAQGLRITEVESEKPAAGDGGKS